MRRPWPRGRAMRRLALGSSCRRMLDALLMQPAVRVGGSVEERVLVGRGKVLLAYLVDRYRSGPGVAAPQRSVVASAVLDYVARCSVGTNYYKIAWRSSGNLE